MEIILCKNYEPCGRMDEGSDQASYMANFVSPLLFGGEKTMGDERLVEEKMMRRMHQVFGQVSALCLMCV
jgi:hypothetical protein